MTSTPESYSTEPKLIETTEQTADDLMPNLIGGSENVEDPSLDIPICILRSGERQSSSRWRSDDIWRSRDTLYQRLMDRLDSFLFRIL